jgi:hypothetical protein
MGDAVVLAGAPPTSAVGQPRNGSGIQLEGVPPSSDVGTPTVGGEPRFKEPKEVVPETSLEFRVIHPADEGGTYTVMEYEDGELIDVYEGDLNEGPVGDW